MRLRAHPLFRLRRQLVGSDRIRADGVMGSIDWRHGVDMCVNCARAVDDSRCRILLLRSRAEKIGSVVDMAVDDVDRCC
jgi:hypothetical protein